MKRLEEKRRRLAVRKKRIRGKIVGTSVRPRLTVFRSNKAIAVQVIDDRAGCTLLSASLYEKELRDLPNNVVGGKKLGEVVGNRLKEAKIETVVFDRKGRAYHGVVRAIAEGAREVGIKL